VRGSVEEALNVLLEAEADRLCNAHRYERSEARRDRRAPATTSAAASNYSDGLRNIGDTVLGWA